MTDAEDVTVRPERPGERETIRALVRLAFGEDLPLRLLDGYYASTGYVPDLSLTAQRGDTIVGHVMLTRVPLLLVPHGVVEVAMLSPLAVHPDWRGHGYARRLVEEACHRADIRRYPLVVLEGNPRMYERLGFEVASTYGIARPSRHVPDWGFQLRRLSAYDPNLRGTVFYPAAIWDNGGVRPH